MLPEASSPPQATAAADAHGPALRIALVTPGFSADERDWCIPILLDFVRQLARHHEVLVLTLRYPHHRRPYEVYGAKVVPLGGAGVRGVRRAWLFRRALAVLRERHRRAPFDVVHAMWAHEPGYLATRFGRRWGVPSVVSVLGGELADVAEASYGGQRERVNRFLANRALRHADAVVSGSRYVRRQAEAHMEPARLIDLPFGVDTDRFSPEPHPSDPETPIDGSPCLLHIASLIPVKDQATLLEAFRTVAEQWPRARLHIVGEGALRQRLETLAASLSIAGQVRWHGAIDHGRLPTLYRAADLFVLTSRFEHNAMAVLEAASCGTPVRGTAVGKLPELVALEQLAAPGDAAALAGHLLAALQDPESLQAEGRRLRRRMLAEFSVTAKVAEHAELYRRLGKTA